MRVVGVRVELPANQPILLLRETHGDRYLPIWIGSVEATAIALEQQGVKPARPLTHDLLKDVVGALGRRLEQVRITDLQEGTFFAELVFGRSGNVSAADDSWPSRSASGCRSAPRMLDEAGLVIRDEQEDEVESFREFLDSISPEDFGGAQPERSPAGRPSTPARARLRRRARSPGDRWRRAALTACGGALTVGFERARGIRSGAVRPAARVGGER